MEPLKPSDAAGQVVEMLMPFPSEDRQRIIAAALVLLGEDSSRHALPGNRASGGPADSDPDASGLPPKAQVWRRQHNISLEQLGSVFHNSGDETEVIVTELPGSNTQEKVLNAYLLTGISQLLSKGEPTIPDADARALCVSSGCYDGPHHTRALNGRGNWFTGSKGAGWTLTAPGLKEAAAVVKALAAASA